MAFSGAQTTRLGLYGGPRPLYGSFAGKELNLSVPCYLDTISLMTDDFLDTQAAITASLSTSGSMADKLDTFALITDNQVDTSGTMADKLDTEGELC